MKKTLGLVLIVGLSMYAAMAESPRKDHIEVVAEVNHDEFNFSNTASRFVSNEYREYSIAELSTSEIYFEPVIVIVQTGYYPLVVNGESASKDVIPRCNSPTA